MSYTPIQDVQTELQQLAHRMRPPAPWAGGTSTFIEKTILFFSAILATAAQNLTRLIIDRGTANRKGASERRVPRVEAMPSSLKDPNRANIRTVRASQCKTGKTAGPSAGVRLLASVWQLRSINEDATSKAADRRKAGSSAASF